MDQETLIMLEPEIQSVTLSWSDLSIILRDGKKLIQSMNGAVQQGQMVAILGGSGAGKTTLLNGLAGKIDDVYECSGSILFNGQERNYHDWKFESGYVEQDDTFYPYLTVQECLEFQARLRLPISKQKERVEKVVMDLGLDHCRSIRVGNTEVRGISGGERKRLSIAQELLTMPQVLFLDEPTSGLDSFTALNLIETLQTLAKKNDSCVIMTIHQPRTELLAKFDKILLISDGNLLFFGSLKEALDHFSSLGFTIPINTNPCDFFLDTITLDRRNVDTMIDSEARITFFVEAWKKIEPLVPFVHPHPAKSRVTCGFSSRFITLVKRDILLFKRDLPQLKTMAGET